MILFCVSGATAPQFKLLRLVTNDFNGAMGYEAVLVVKEGTRVGRNPCHPLHFSDDGFHDLSEEAFGYTQLNGELFTIGLRPVIGGCELYEIFLHELGHVFGLGHVEDKRLVMAIIRDRGPRDAGPTPRQRKTKVSQIAKAIMRFRLKNWQP